MKYTKLEEAVEKNTRYMLVAEETAGGIPMFNRIGLKIVPPPRPKAPEINPPTNPRVTNYITVFPVNLMSLSTMPRLYLIFKYCSYLLILTPI